ncbi:hypothetical protein OPQ81_000898 [Rhizoctonia solani]|nr:hypothetical protein OPQ81_000898 [Rhizoctonia solani]
MGSGFDFSPRFQGISEQCLIACIPALLDLVFGHLVRFAQTTITAGVFVPFLMLNSGGRASRNMALLGPVTIELPCLVHSHMAQRGLEPNANPTRRTLEITR